MSFALLFTSQDGSQVGRFRDRSVRINVLGRRDGEAGVVALEIAVAQEVVALVDRADVGEAQFFGEPILQGAINAFDASFGLW